MFIPIIDEDEPVSKAVGSVSSESIWWLHDKIKSNKANPYDQMPI